MHILHISALYENTAQNEKTRPFLALGRGRQAHLKP
jgi:hypothetical protein